MAASVEERRARRALIFLVVSLVVLLAGAGVVYATRGGRSPGVASTRLLPGGSSAPEAIGPANGDLVASYTAGRQQALQAAGGNRVAVVSLDQYLPAAKAGEMVGRMQVLTVLAAAPGGLGSVVSGSIEQWQAEQRKTAEADRKSIQELLDSRSVGDPEFEAFYRSELVRLDALQKSLVPDGPVVYAVVVRAPVDELKALAAKPGVRMVDVGQSDRAASDYRGLRPEERVKVGDPPTRPVA